jgi:uncharacterized repeat protein (TIGR03843 family)
MVDSATRPLSLDRALALLTSGQLTVAGYVPWSSNATLVAEVSDGTVSLQAIYKPQRGERPLWDFAAGTLCHRETAAYVVSEALGWELVPPTVLRDGPLGPGAVQLLIPHDPDLHYLALAAPDADVVQRIVAFDIIANNADRKSGHVLVDSQGQLWLIDHGVTFHRQWKLRTVIWDYAGRPLPRDIRSDLADLAAELALAQSALRQALAPLLAAGEIRALADRTHDLLAAGRFPAADPERRAVPWPLV